MTPGAAALHRRTLLVLALGCAAAVCIIGPSTPAEAHLGTPFGDVLGPLLEAEIVVLARAVEGTRVDETGGRTSVVVVAALAGRAPARIELVQPPPHFHRHRPGTVFVAPLVRLPGGRFRVLSETSTPLDAEVRDAPALRELLRSWRTLPRPTPASVRFRHALGHLQSPTALGRRVVLEQLLGGVSGGIATDDDDHALATAIENPGLPEAYRLGLVRFASLARRTHALDRLCGAEAALTPALRSAVFAARFDPPTPCVRAAVRACAARSADPLVARCRSLAARLPP